MKVNGKLAVMKYSRLIKFLHHEPPILKSQNIIYLPHCHTVHIYLTTIHLRHQLTTYYQKSFFPQLTIIDWNSLYIYPMK